VYCIVPSNATAEESVFEVEIHVNLVECQCVFKNRVSFPNKIKTSNDDISK